MSNENEPCTWPEMEGRLLATSAQLMAVVMQAAQARADAENGSQTLNDLLRRDDLRPALSVVGDSMRCDLLTLAITLHSRATGAPVARLFQITAQAKEVPCLH